MSNSGYLRRCTAAFDHHGTLVVVLELSGRSWLIGAEVPGLERRPRKPVTAGSVEDVLRALEDWRQEALRAGKRIERTVVAYEAGRDGFWIARELSARGVEVYVMQASSIPVDRRKRRVKTDRIDLDLLLRTLLAWLRGEPRVCSMVSIPTVEEEDARRPTRERERLVKERGALESQLRSIWARFGIAGFNPRRRDADAQLDRVRDRQGQALPPYTIRELRHLLTRVQLVERQIKEIEASRAAALAEAAAARAGAPAAGQRLNPTESILLLMQVPGIAAETAAVLVAEGLDREFRNSRAVGSYAGLTGTPYASGGSHREQGISKSGNPRLRRCLIMLAWRWVRLAPDHPLSRWFRERTAGGKGRIRKIMIVAMARKLLILLWRLVTHGVVPPEITLKAA